MSSIYIGQRSRYVLKSESPIAHGRLADIYLAEDQNSRSTVALKCFRGYFDQTESLVSFHREVAALSSIHHPNILEIIDFGDTEEANEREASPRASPRY